MREQRVKDIEEQSFVVGGHLIDPNLHQSITDPEIQTINEKKRKQERREARRIKKKKREKAKEDK